MMELFLISHVAENPYFKQICILSGYSTMVVYAKKSCFKERVVLTLIYMTCVGKWPVLEMFDLVQNPC